MKVLALATLVSTLALTWPAAALGDDVKPVKDAGPYVPSLSAPSPPSRDSVLPVALTVSLPSPPTSVCTPVSD